MKAYTVGMIKLFGKKNVNTKTGVLQGYCELHCTNFGVWCFSHLSGNDGLAFCTCWNMCECTWAKQSCNYVTYCPSHMTSLVLAVYFQLLLYSSAKRPQEVISVRCVWQVQLHCSTERHQSETLVVLHFLLNFTFPYLHY